MTHVLFAMFDRGEAASRALGELRRARRNHPRVPVEVVLHRDHLEVETLPLSSTNGRRRMAHAVVQGLLVGAALGLVLHVLGIAEVKLTVLLPLTMLMGAFIGALGGVLTGVAAPDEALERVTADLGGGSIALTFSTADGDLFEKAETIFVENGARTERRAAA